MGALILLSPGLAKAAGTTFTQTIMTELRYDTNARIASEGQLGGDDFTLLLVPNFQFVNQRDRLELTLDYRLTGYFYFRNPDLNTISHETALSADYKLTSQSSISVEDRLIYTKEALESTLTGMQSNRDTIITNLLSVSLASQLTHRTSMSLSASDYILRFDDPVAVDSRNNSVSAGLQFQATPETQMNGSYSYSSVSFDLPGGDSSHQSSHSLNTGFNMNFRETASLALSAGAVYADTTSTGDGFFDWLAAAEIRKTWPKYNASVRYARQTTSSSGVIDQLTMNESVSGSLNHNFNRNIDAGVFGTYTRNHSRPNDALDTTSIAAGVSSHWRLRDWLSFGLGYTHFKQTSHGTLGEDIERDHVFFSVQATTYEGRL